MDAKIVGRDGKHHIGEASQMLSFQAYLSNSWTQSLVSQSIRTYKYGCITSRYSSVISLSVNWLINLAIFIECGNMSDFGKFNSQSPHLQMRSQEEYQFLSLLQTTPSLLPPSFPRSREQLF
jgi:hypothetical protein